MIFSIYNRPFLTFRILNGIWTKLIIIIFVSVILVLELSKIIKVFTTKQKKISSNFLKK